MAEGFRIADAFVEVTTRDSTAPGLRGIRVRMDTATRDRTINVKVQDRDALGRFTGLNRAGQGLSTTLITATTSAGGLARALAKAGPAGQVGVGIAGVALVGLTRQAIAATGAIGLIPAALAAVGAGVGTVKLGLSGISETFAALKAAEKSSAATASSAAASRATSAKQALSASRSLADARRQQAQQEITGARQVAEARRQQARQEIVSNRQLQGARRSLDEAEDDATRERVRGLEEIKDARRALTAAEVDAADSVTDARERYADAQRAELSATKGLNEAREEAIENLQQLRFAIRGAALSEKEATDRLVEAQEALQRARMSGSYDASGLEEFETAVDRAQLTLEQAVDRYGDLKREGAEWARTGVEGSDRMVAAQERVTEAQAATADAAAAIREAQAEGAARIAEAERGLEESRRAAAEANVDAAERVAEAQRGMAEAQMSARWAAEDAARAVVEAQESARLAAEDAARGVADAQAAVADAVTETGAAGVAATDGVADAMANLTPAAREVVQAIRDLGPAWDDVRRTTQQNLLEGVGGRITEMGNTYIPHLKTLLGGIASSFNDAFHGVADFLMSDRAQADLNQIMSNIRVGLDNASGAAVPLSEALLDILSVGSDFLPELGADIASGAEDFAAFIRRVRESGDLKAWMQDAIDLGGDLVQLGKDIFDFVSWFAHGVDVLTEKTAEEVQGIRAALEGGDIGDSWFSNFLETVNEVGAPVAGLLNGIAGAGEEVGTKVEEGGRRAGGGVFGMVDPIGQTREEMRLLRGEVDLTTGALGSQIDALRRLHDQQGVTQEKTARFTEAVRVNGTQHDVTRTAAEDLVVEWENEARAASDATARTWDNYGSLGANRAQSDLTNEAIVRRYRSLNGPERDAMNAALTRLRDQGIELGAIGRAMDVLDGKRADIVIDAEGRSHIKSSVHASTGKPIRWLDNEFAEGGILPGYTPGRDVHDFTSPSGGRVRLSGGEAILRPEATRGLGAGFIHGVNRAAKQGGVASVRRFASYGGDFGAYANGGVFEWAPDAVKRSADVSTKRAQRGMQRLVKRYFERMAETGGEFLGDPESAVGKALAWARTQAGKPYDWASSGPGGYDCSGFMSAITNHLRGKPLHNRVGATGNFPWSGFKPGPSPNPGMGFTIGSRTGSPGHMAGTLGGVQVESSGGRGVSVGQGGRNASDRMFTTQAHLFDRGGVARGVGLMPKATIEPERVLPPSTTKALDAAIDRGIGDTYNVSVTIDARTIKEMQDVSAFFATVKQQARKGSGQVAGVRS